MYFPDYNPTLHDPYLYGSGNTGYPIALNPDCLLYDARDSYRAISRRFRDWDRGNGSEGSPTVPPGTPVSLFPNYYNNNEPLYTKISNETIGCSTHFTVFFCRTSSSNLSGYNVTPQFAQETIYETGLSLGIASVSYWNDDFSGFNTTTDFQLPFNYISTVQPGGITFSFYKSSEGQTYYQVLNRDHGLMKKNNFNGSNGLTGEFLSSIHPFALFDIDILKELYSYQNGYRRTKSSNSFPTNSFRIPVENVYFWGGNDTIAPVDFVDILVKSFITDVENFYNKFPLIVSLTGYIKNSILWPGDSSGLFLYKKNNKLYSIGHAYTTLSTTENDENYRGAQGPIHSGVFLPNLAYFLQTIDAPVNHFFSNKTSKRIATKTQFKQVTELLNNTNKLVEEKISELN
jgi:hypothetical protein